MRYVGVAREETARHQRLIGEAKQRRRRRCGIWRSIRSTGWPDAACTTASSPRSRRRRTPISMTIVAKEETKFVLILDCDHRSAELRRDPARRGRIRRRSRRDPGARQRRAHAGGGEGVRRRVGVGAVAQVTNLARAIETLKKGGYWVYAAAEDGERPDRDRLHAARSRSWSATRGKGSGATSSSTATAS